MFCQDVGLTHEDACERFAITYHLQLMMATSHDWTYSIKLAPNYSCVYRDRTWDSLTTNQRALALIHSSMSQIQRLTISFTFSPIFRKESGNYLHSSNRLEACAGGRYLHHLVYVNPDKRLCCLKFFSGWSCHTTWWLYVRKVPWIKTMDAVPTYRVWRRCV